MMRAWFSVILLMAVLLPNAAMAYISTPQTVSPSDSSEGVYPYVFYRWNDVYYMFYKQSAQAAPPEGVYFRLQVSTDTSFSTTVLDVSGISDTAYYSFSRLDDFTTYYWRVNATDGEFITAWSPYAEFRTLIGPPTADAPDDGAIGVPVSPTFTWFSLPGATSYNLTIEDGYGEEYQTQSANSSYVVYTASSIGDTMHTVPGGNLEFYMEYYWEVSANETGGTGHGSSYNWFRTIAPPTTLVTPANGESGQPLDPTLMWNSSSYALSYEVELSDDSSFSSPQYSSSGSDTTASVPANLLQEGTTYYWRVRYAETGGITDWSLTGNFRTVTPPPILSSPADGSTGRTMPVFLSWLSVTGADSYRVQVSLDPNFIAVVADIADIEGTSVEVSGLNHFTNYYWRVLTEESGEESNWSSAWQFRTIIPPAVPVSPSDGTLAVSYNPDLVWDDNIYASGYRVQVSRNPYFEAPEIDVNNLQATMQSVAHDLQPYSLYYWRVAAIEAPGIESWSDPQGFRTAVPPPNLLDPKDGQTALFEPIFLSWSDVNGAETYAIEFSTSEDFTQGTYIVDDIADNSLEMRALQPYTQYYWRMSSSEEAGAGPYGGTKSFRTIISEPTQQEPARNEQGVVLEPVLTWNELPGADSYELELVEGTEFEDTAPSVETVATTAVAVNSPVPVGDGAGGPRPPAPAVINTSFSESGLTGTQYQASGLTHNTLYSWRLRGIDDGVAGPWSEILSFTTQLIGPTLLYPNDGQTDVGGAESFEWNPYPGSTEYRLQIAEDAAFSSLLFDVTGIQNTNTYIEPLPYNTTFYWRVTAYYQGNYTDWSEVWSFTTGDPPPDAPVLLEPVDDAMKTEIDLTLLWRQVPLASGYNVQVAEDQMFSTYLVDQSTTDTSWGLSGLDYGAEYFWRIGSEGTNETPVYSSPRSFITKIPAPVLQSPVDGFTTSDQAVRLQWSAVSEASTYTLEISTDPGFATLHVNAPNLSNTEYNFNSLSPQKTYYWRVKAVSQISESDWTNAWKISTLGGEPVLVSPLDGAMDQPLSLELEWQSFSGASSYTVQVAPTRAFASPVVDDAGVTMNTHMVSLPDYGTTYFWRVNARTSNGTTDWSVIWEFTTVVQQVDAPMLVSPPDGSTGNDATLDLLWSSVPGAASYEVWLSKDPSFATGLMEYENLTDTSLSVGPLDAGDEYHWRVYAIDGAGGREASTDWSFRIGGGVPVLAAPTDGTEFLTNPVTLRWDAVPGADSYRVQVARNAIFSALEHNEDVTGGTQFDADNLTAGTLYFWRVNSSDPSGTSDWSEVWQFRMQPAGPALVTPLANAMAVPTELQLVWTPVAAADSYHLQVAEDAAFNTTVVDQTALTAAEYTASLNEAETYYWRVRSNYPGGISAWSQVRQFTTGDAQPTLLMPANGAADQPYFVEFGWEAFQGATGYQLQVATDMNFTAVELDQTGISGTSYEGSGFDPETEYFWRLRAETSSGPSGWSAVWSFLTGTFTPILTQPGNGASGLTDPVTFGWDAVEGAVGYDFELAEDAAFANIVQSSPGLGSTTTQVGGLSGGAVFYWRVRADFGVAKGPWSTEWNFSTEGDIPVLLAPANNATDVPLPVQLTWQEVNGATSYRLQVAEDAAFTTPVIDESISGGTFYDAATLSNGTQYFWRVNAEVPAGTTAWSTVWTFTTEGGIPDPPQLVSPGDGAANVPLAVVFSWQESPGADTYRIEVSESSNFTSLVFEDEGLTAPTASSDPLQPATTYYWHVNASNASGSSAYSGTWSFTTAGGGGGIQVAFGDAELGAPFTVEVTALSGFDIASGYLFYRLVGETEYDSIPLSQSETVWSAQVPGNAVTERGLQTWIRAVSTTAGIITEPPVQPADNPVYHAVSFPSLSYGLPLPEREYRMVSIPANVEAASMEAVFQDDMGPVNPLWWRLAHWNGSGYDELPTPLPDMQPGRAYWLISAIGVPFDIEAGQSIDPSEPLALTFEPGWTQVGGPYAFRVEWATIPGSEQLSTPYLYDGVEYVPDQLVLRPYEGYFIFNPNAGPIVLNIPPVEAPPGLTKTRQTAALFELAVKAFDGATGAYDTQTRVGIVEGNAYRLPEPPPIAANINVSVRDGGEKLMRSYEQWVGGGKVWELTIEHAEEAVLQFATSGSMPQGAGLYILDLDARRALPYSGGEVRLDNRGLKERSLRVIIGSAAFAGKHSNGIDLTPREFGLAQNFPNPFREHTTISYTVAEPSHVSIEVYNRLGERVATIVDGWSEAGAFAVDWHTGSPAGRMPAGTYVLRMQAGSFSTTSNITILR